MVAKNAFLLQQLLDLNDALQRPAGTARSNPHPYGDYLWPNPLRLQILQEISRRRSAGDSFARIAYALNKQGVRGEYGGRWYGTSVRNFIRRNPDERGGAGGLGPQ